MITENLSTLKIHRLTKAQYERELAAGNIDENALYLTPEEENNLDAHIDDKNNPHEVTLTQLGVTATADKINILNGITASTTELNHVTGVTSGIQSQLNSKQTNITGAATTITGSNLNADKALISNASGKVAVSEVTSTELGYIRGVTSNVQTQINTKLALSDFDNTITNYYTKTEIDNIELITPEDIDTICGTTIQVASEVTF